MLPSEPHRLVPDSRFRRGWQQESAFPVLRTAGSSPDTHCDTEQVSLLSWVSVFPTCERGPPIRIPQACRPGREAARTALARASPNCWLSSLRHAHPHHLGAQPAGAVVPVSPTPCDRGTRPRKPGRPAPALPRGPRPLWSPARLPTGVRLQETERSPLSAPATRRSPDDPANSARPPGGPQRLRRGQ